MRVSEAWHVPGHAGGVNAFLPLPFASYITCSPGQWPFSLGRQAHASLQPWLSVCAAHHTPPPELIRAEDLLQKSNEFFLGGRGMLISCLQKSMT